MANQGHWYGGGETLRAAWPLEKGHIKLSAFVTGDEVGHSHKCALVIPL